MSSRYWCDGLARGNPGPAAIGITSNVGWEYSARLGVATNNQAEYAALVIALERIQQKGGSALVYMDSKLVVNQVNGRWACRSPSLSRLYNRALELLQGLDVEIEWVPREKNRRADELANKAIDEGADFLAVSWWESRSGRSKSDVCLGCGGTEVQVKQQRFRDGTVHRRAECARCGRFLRYLPRK